MRLSHLIATTGCVGLLRPAPGTWGSLAALPLALGVIKLGGLALLLIALVAVILGGVWAIAQESKITGAHDAKEWVIDEVAGQWIALLPVAFGAHMMGADVTRLWPGWIAALIFFRLFDITKPWLVGRADRKGTPFSVMEDDLWAGLFAAISTSALAAFSHMVLM